MTGCSKCQENLTSTRLFWLPGQGKLCFNCLSPEAKASVKAQDDLNTRWGQAYIKACWGLKQ